MPESNRKCPKCGDEMFKTDSVLQHTYFCCRNCRYLLAVKGQKHWFHCDEIDLETGEIIPYKEL